MAIFPIILDTCPAFLRSGSVPSSLILTPLGTGILLDYLHACVLKVSSEKLVILTGFDAHDSYRQAVRNANPRVDLILPLSEIDQLLLRYESSDFLLFIDARYFPVREPDLSKWMHKKCDPFNVKHLATMDCTVGGTREYALMETDGSIRRIQRFYHGVTWHRVSSIVCSLVPAFLMRMVGGDTLTSLMDLRIRLASAGISSQDIALETAGIDLSRPQELLGLNDHLVCEGVSQNLPSHYRRIKDHVLVGDKCDIHPTARIIGPVVIQHNVIIEKDTDIIGPALLGAGSRITQGAVVAQTLVLPQTVVPGDTVLRQCIFGQGQYPLTGSKESDSHTSSVAEFSIDRGGQHPFSTPLASPGIGFSLYPAVKRGLEAIIAAAGLLLLSPLLIAVAIMIRLTSKGPVLFGHEREGKDGKVFKCLKFRTMVKDAHVQQRALYARNQVDGPQFKLPNDPRITRIGRWIRTTNIDELPQLINVLLGQMSLIGPRPSPFRENQICVPWRQARLSVRPGITGLWQICRHEREAGDFHQWIYYDMLYVRHMSFRMDLKILTATLLTLGGRRSVPLSWIIPDRQLQEKILPLAVSTATPRLNRSKLNNSGSLAATDFRPATFTATGGGAGG
ncbi:MAG: sugar transferase [Phycisphaerae bacterium]